ncbi:MAG: phosphate ABC transporter permease PstA [Polyangiaceae bacterium]
MTGHPRAPAPKPSSPGALAPGRSLARATRPGRAIERAILIALALTAASMVAVYGGGLVYLVGKGIGKVASFTVFPTPLANVRGETGMRVAVGLALFGATAWALGSVVFGVLERMGRAPSMRSRRITVVASIAVVLGASVLARDHLPRFLITLPSETKAGGGIGPEIFNTMYFAVLSTAVSLPIGVGAAVYIARFARKGPWVGAIRVALSTLASVPSIVYGLFGFLVFVVLMKAGYSLFAGAFVLALLNLPLVVSLSEEAIRSVPRELEEASYALGATRVQTVVRVTLPHAWPGILSATVLSIGRVFAESAPLIMTAGTTISRVNAYALDPFRGGETLAVHLWYVNSAGLAPDRAEVSAGTAAVLILLVTLTNAIAHRLSKRVAGAQRGARKTG